MEPIFNPKTALLFPSILCVYNYFYVLFLNSNNNRYINKAAMVPISPSYEIPSLDYFIDIILNN